MSPLLRFWQDTRLRLLDYELARLGEALWHEHGTEDVRPLIEEAIALQAKRDALLMRAVAIEQGKA